ncbi:TPA: hypothetical protein N3022_005797 [Klebsiella pneumoniae]|nr:hypothetical protein [Klebsiella pneumoniae]HCM7502068.1 hypothetical protein [Klebsiella pneumoniae]
MTTPINESLIEKMLDVYRSIIDDGVHDLGYELIEGKYHSFKDMVVIPVMSIKKSINLIDHGDVEVMFKDELVAHLCLLTESSEEYKSISSFNENKLLCLFSELSGNEIPAAYDFGSNYIVTQPGMYSKYKAEMVSSEYWGGYSHNLPRQRNAKLMPKVDIVENISFVTENHKVSILNAIETTSSFERYLKYYHQIELLFDVIPICRLKAIQSVKIKDYQDVISEFSNRSEFKNLSFIINQYVSDEHLEDIVTEMKNVTTFIDLAVGMFQNLGKKENPIPGHNEWNVLVELLSNDSLNDANTNKYQWSDGGTPFSVKLKNPSNTTYKGFVLNLASYWIYRVRCSIAHNRIGEYIFEYEDENFITDFMESLILKVIQSIGSNAELHETLAALPSESPH